MTNKEKFIEVFGDNPQRHHITKSWCDEEYVPQSKTGHWVATGRIFIELNGEQIVYEVICDSCSGLAYFRRTMGDLVNAKYCPRCGIKMGGQKWID